METINNILRKSLSKVSWSPTPWLDLEIILSHIIKKDRVFISANSDFELSRQQEENFDIAVNRRHNQEPVAYIIGHKNFLNYDFCVNSNVLIPRPETELLVEEALRYIKNAEVNSVADIGTGSGCIITSIAKELQKQKSAKESKFIATDISQDALQVARNNYEFYFPNQEIKIEFIQSNLLEKVQIKIDLLISNLPYIPLNEYIQLEKNVIDYEPKRALLGGEDGYELIIQLFEQSQRILSDKFLILLEINHNQGKVLSDIAKTYFPESKIDIIKDYANLDRILKIENV